MTNDSQNTGGTGLHREDTHAILLAVIGGYLIYLGYQVLEGTLSGSSTMSMTATVLSVAFLAFSGLGVMAYGLKIWRGSRKKKDPEETRETT